MAAFDDLRTARANAAAQDDAVAAGHERIARLRGRLAELERQSDPERPTEESGRLRSEIAAAERQLERDRGERSELRRLAAAELEKLASKVDPREAIGGLDDGLPILLLPVRLETRFMRIGSDNGAATRQLWVRIYPDDCSIDTFEATLTDIEIRSVRAYWSGIWKAGGVPDQERAAWRDLVASHGSGRAAWIVSQVQPLNPGERPTKADPVDVVLVVVLDTPLPAAEQDPVTDYWQAVWLADGAKLEQDAALDALADAVGDARAAELAEATIPVNLADRPAPPLEKTDVAVSAAFLVLTPDADHTTKAHSWTRAPKAALLPERFVFIGFAGSGPPVVQIGRTIPSPLVVGPDPYAPEDERLRQRDDGELEVPEDMRWMVDFERAVEDGMGLRVDLSGAALEGFDRVFVIGLRLVADPETARQELETLLTHHALGRGGFSLLPQGTPTNNVEEAPSGLERGDDPDASFDDLAAPFEDTTDWFAKRDGQWLAELLGIDPEVLRTVRHASGLDQADARAMHSALWPATLGYWMETMMKPVLDETTVDVTRRFFTRFVLGRGAVPAIRIGRQPYGIQPATAFSRMGWFSRDSIGVVALPGAGYLSRLYAVLRAMDADWAAMAAGVAQVGRPGGDAHRTLLDVLGLHPASVEFAQRYAEGLDHVVRRLRLGGFASAAQAMEAKRDVQRGEALLRRLGYGGELPEILSKVFFGRHNALKGPTIDDRPLSEVDPVHPTTIDGRNYLQWLVDAARTSQDALYRQEGFEGGRPPTALLYLMLRHALQLGYHDTGVRLHLSAGLFDLATARRARVDAPFLHLSQRAAVSESRYALLYSAAPRITDSDVLLGDYIGPRVSELDDAAQLADQLRGLEHLATASTARLERAFAEHVDLCSHRLDAWLLGLVHAQLATMRGLSDGGEAGEPRRGIHLGAYAWLEDLRPQLRQLEPVELEGELAEVFKEGRPLRRDSSNLGYVHAPSLNQAVAAAVLRSGYVSDAGPAAPGSLAVNLTSERVRGALGMLEGIREGQSLGALLGYQLERGLHDRHALAEVDQFILDLRKAFPLRADRLASTSTKDQVPPVPIEALEARNVMDGLALVEHVRATGQASYPFGKPLPPAGAAEREAIDAEVQRLLDRHDAVADLALAEGVYQAVLGNYDRVASTYEAYSKGSFPPEPQVVRTPTSGIGLTHRVALHLDPDADPGPSPTPRARCEPAVNAWLAGLLPAPGDVGCRVRFVDAATNAPDVHDVTLADLDLQPADLLAVLRDEGDQGMRELDDRVLRALFAAASPRPDEPIEIAYMDAGGAELSVFEVLPLARCLQRVTQLSRPLRATDGRLTAEAGAKDDAGVLADPGPVVAARADLEDVRDDLEAFRAALAAPLDDVDANRDAIVAGIDTTLEELVALLVRAAAFGVPQTGWGFAYDARRRIFVAALARAAEVASRWTDRLDEADARLQDADDASTPADARIELLKQVERLVSTSVTVPVPADFRTKVGDKRDAFAAARDDFAAFANTSRTTIAGLLADIDALLPVAELDTDEPSFAEEAAEAVRFAQDALSVAEAVLGAIDRRLEESQARLDEHGGTAVPAVAVAALQAAARALLGEDFVLLPRFRLDAAHGEELRNALAASEAGTLFEHLDDDFPVDTWLYGVARVRGKLHDWEQTVMLAGAFALDEPELTALQLPFAEGDRWLALDLPEKPGLDRERLLYTAHFAVAFDETASQCGLLLDDWTEVIPSEDATTGLTFHYDRPSTEAPQAMLLVTPPTFSGRWRWQDLVDALGETLDLAKRRAVEPVHVDASPYAPFLPATVMAVTTRQLSIAANLALNNAVDLMVSKEG